MRILVADDSPDAADTLAVLLRRWGHEVRVDYDGLSALRLARRCKPHAVLLDVQMPRMNGAKVARRLRRRAGSERMKVIATSATDPDDGRLAPYDGVFDAYLVKP